MFFVIIVTCHETHGQRVAPVPNFKVATMHEHLETGILGHTTAC